MRAPIAVVALLAFVAACSPVAEEPNPPDPVLVAVGEAICSEMWDWQLDIGRIMNAMSSASFREDDPAARLTLYTSAFESARQRNNDLREQIGTWPAGPFVDQMREDVRNGLFTAEQEITDLDATVDELYARGDDGYHAVVSRIVIGFEKVIDLAKPELATYGDKELTKAFITVPACQHGVKDANDGIPRFVPSS